MIENTGLFQKRSGGMDQTKIKCFLALARTLNFTRAAEQVFLTQQAVSKSIASLENELQLQLFERTTRAVLLTDEGERIFELFDRMDREFEATIAELKRQQRPYTLHVGYQNYISFYDKLRQAKNSLLHLYPEIALDGERYAPPVLRDKLRKHELDIIVIYSRFFTEKPEDYCRLPLCELQQYFMVSDEIVLPEGHELEALRKETFILDRVERETPKELNIRKETELKKWGFTGEAQIVSDRDSAYTLAEMGEGVVVGTDLSIMAAGRTLRQYNCGIPETLIAVWRAGETRNIVSQYAAALQHAFGSGEKASH